jgi:hypothetical protein
MSTRICPFKSWAKPKALGGAIPKALHFGIDHSLGPYTRFIPVKPYHKAKHT